MISDARARSIIAQVARKDGVAMRELMSGYRDRRIVVARWRAFAALRSEGVSCNRIGALMGRDHSTVMHGLRKLAEASACV